MRFPSFVWDILVMFVAVEHSVLELTLLSRASATTVGELPDAEMATPFPESLLSLIGSQIANFKILFPSRIFRLTAWCVMRPEVVSVQGSPSAAPIHPRPYIEASPFPSSAATDPIRR